MSGINEDDYLDIPAFIFGRHISEEDRRMVACSACGGEGENRRIKDEDRRAGWEPCPWCEGRGWYTLGKDRRV